jgi:hypothetical protein
MFGRNHLPAFSSAVYLRSPCVVTTLLILYVEIKCQLDAKDDFYCRSYCLLNMFRPPLCSSSGAREYYTGGCCLWYLVSQRYVQLTFNACTCSSLPHSHNQNPPHYRDAGTTDSNQPNSTPQKKAYLEHPHTAPTTPDMPYNKHI